jgi:ABC-type transport system involved in cytochrome c biogenesis ATPase subunit
MESLLERGPAPAVLREVLAEAATGCGGVVLVSGEPGVGKSSLLRVIGLVPMAS